LLSQAVGFKEIMQIKYLTEKLQREMNGLKIVRRHKRGLANFVGTAYKYLCVFLKVRTFGLKKPLQLLAMHEERPS